MSFKIPCGGFKLDEKSFSLDKNDVLYISKPLTYDYMPEGYPSKSVGTVTLMEEQEVTFTDGGGTYRANAPVQFDVQNGKTYTVVWDGVEYSCAGLVNGGVGLIGNPTAFGAESTGEPFAYAVSGEQHLWLSYDTATSHTIKVMRQQETITPMDVNFIPNTIQRVGDDVIIPSSTPDSTKKFKITVDDSGAISATEVT